MKTRSSKTTVSFDAHSKDWALTILNALDKPIYAACMEYADTINNDLFAALQHTIVRCGLNISLTYAQPTKATHKPLDLSSFALVGPESGLGVVFSESVQTIQEARWPYAVIVPAQLPNQKWVDVVMHQCFHVTHFLEPQILASFPFYDLGLVIVEPFELFVKAFAAVHKQSFKVKGPPIPAARHVRSVKATKTPPEPVEGRLEAAGALPEASGGRPTALMPCGIPVAPVEASRELGASVKTRTAVVDGIGQEEAT